METETVTQSRPRVPKKAPPNPQEIAERIFADMLGRFPKLVKEKVSGYLDDSGEMRLTIGSHKHACEACFKPETNYDRILQAFRGWAEGFAIRLGAKPFAIEVSEDE